MKIYYFEIEFIPITKEIHEAMNIAIQAKNLLNSLLINYSFEMLDYEIGAIKKVCKILDKIENDANYYKIISKIENNARLELRFR